MGRKKKHAEHVNHERWLISYADFITLLFAFFVVMFSASQVDQRRLGAFSESFAGAQGITVIPRGADGLMAMSANTPSPREALRPTTDQGAAFRLENLAISLNNIIQRNPRMESVRVIRRRNDFVLRMPAHVFFESGAASVKVEAVAILTTIATALRPLPVDLRVEGHTDCVPIRTSRYLSNWELSTARATSVLQLLVAGDGIPPAHLSASGYGEFRPICSNDTDDGRQQNRRVDIVVSIHNSANDEAAGDAAVAVAAISAELGSDAAAVTTDDAAAPESPLTEPVNAPPPHAAPAR